MEWKETLKSFEDNKQWNDAIAFMQEVLVIDPFDMEAYIAMLYLLINLIVEEDYDDTKYDDYEVLAKKYFDESYLKFSDNPEYLFYLSYIVCRTLWIFKVTAEEVNSMPIKAFLCCPSNPVYQWNYYRSVAKQNPEDPNLVAYAKDILREQSAAKQILQTKGAMGACLFDMMLFWAKKILQQEEEKT